MVLQIGLVTCLRYLVNEVWKTVFEPSRLHLAYTCVAACMKITSKKWWDTIVFTSKLRTCVNFDQNFKNRSSCIWVYVKMPALIVIAIPSEDPQTAC